VESWEGPFRQPSSWGFGIAHVVGDASRYRWQTKTPTTGVWEAWEDQPQVENNHSSFLFCYFLIDSALYSKCRLFMKKVFTFICFCLISLANYAQEKEEIFPITKEEALKFQTFDDALKVPPGYTIQSSRFVLIDKKKRHFPRICGNI
jgi:hypothetical protein